MMIMRRYIRQNKGPRIYMTMSFTLTLGRRLCDFTIRLDVSSGDRSSPQTTVDVPSKDLDLHPVEDDQGSVTSTVKGRDVCRPPEEVGSDTIESNEVSSASSLDSRRVRYIPSTGKVSVEEGQIGNGLFATDVSERTLVRVVEGGQVQGLVQSLDGSLDIVTGSLFTHLGELLLELFSLGHLGESPGEVSSLLTGSLGGGCVRSGGTVTESKDLGCSGQSHVAVDDETSSLGLVFGQLGHQVAGDLSRGVSGGPDQQSVGNLLDLLVGILDDDRLFTHVLDHGSGKDVDLVLLEGGFSVLDELFRKGRQDVGEGFDQGDSELVGDLGVPLSQVVLWRSSSSSLVSMSVPAHNATTRTHDQEVVQLSGVLDTGRTSTDDDHVHEPLDLLLGLSGKCGGLDTVQEFTSDPVGILELLQETSVLLDTLDTEGLILGTDGVDEVVVRDGHLGRGGGEFRVV